MAKKDIPLSIDDLDENPLIEWINKNKWNIASGFVIALMAIFLLYRFFSGTAIKNERDYFEAEIAQTKLMDASSAEKALDQLKGIVASHPELQAKYDGVMAETYLLLNQPEEAKPLIERNLNRIQENPYSKKSAEIALLMGENKWEEARALSMSLKKDLEAMNPNTLPVLYLYNLYRLISLNQKLGATQEEKTLISEWFNLSKNGEKLSITPIVFDAFVKTLNLGDVSFINYIQERQNQLQ